MKNVLIFSIIILTFCIFNELFPYDDELSNVGLVVLFLF